jgi:hypothetical protein
MYTDSMTKCPKLAQAARDATSAQNVTKGSGKGFPRGNEQKYGRRDFGAGR